MTVPLAFVAVAVVSTLARVGIGAALNRPGLPLGTLVVNVVGAFALGVLAGRGASTETLTVLGTGALGSLTTFSTLSHESMQLCRQRRVRRSALYLTVTLVAGVGAAWAGLWLGG